MNINPNHEILISKQIRMLKTINILNKKVFIRGHSWLQKVSTVNTVRKIRLFMQNEPNFKIGQCSLKII